MSGRLPRLPGVVATVDTADQGYFFGGTIYLVTAINRIAIVSTNDQVRVLQFVLPFRTIVRRIAFEITTAQASSFAGVGIYSIDGNTLLLESGAISTTVAERKTASITAVTLEPGPYFFAQTCDGTTALATHIAIPSDVREILNAQAVDKLGLAANSGTAGALPATLGTITASALSTMVALFEP